MTLYSIIAVLILCAASLTGAVLTYLWQKHILAEIRRLKVEVYAVYHVKPVPLAVARDLAQKGDQVFVEEGRHYTESSLLKADTNWMFNSGASVKRMDKKGRVGKKPTKKAKKTPARTSKNA